MKAQNLLNEFHRIFFREADEGQWLGGLKKPMPTTLPMEEKVQHFAHHAYVMECNESFARMHGYDFPVQLIGVRLSELFVFSESINKALLEVFFASDLTVRDAISHERDRQGRSVYFFNTCTGIVDNGSLIRVWGTQRRMTDERLVHVLKNLEVLSHLQRTIFDTTVQGRTLKEIAAVTGLTISTVETYRKRLLKKFRLHSIQELLLVAGQLQIARSDPTGSFTK